MTVKQAVKYNLVTFVDGNASLDVAMMLAVPGQDELGGDEPVLYTLSFDLNYTGASNPPPNQEIDEGGKVTLPSPAPAREGYTFDGWCEDAAGTTRWDFDIDTVKAPLIYSLF